MPEKKLKKKIVLKVDEYSRLEEHPETGKTIRVKYHKGDEFEVPSELSKNKKAFKLKTVSKPKEKKDDNEPRSPRDN